MNIKITFLGTGAVVPTVKRNHSAIFLNYKDENILIDCGEGTQRQFRIAKINPCSLTRILITHWHGDHILGLPGLFQTLALNNYNKTLYIYGPKGTKKYVNELFKVFVPMKKIKIEVKEVSGNFLKTKDFEIYAYPLVHGNAPTLGYYLKEKDKLRIHKDKLKKLKLTREEEAKLGELTNGKTIKIKNKVIKPKDITYLQKGKKISFIFDTKLCKNIERIAKDSDLAIVDSTYSNKDEALALEREHLTSVQAAKIAKKSKVQRLILTHISQRYDNNSSELENQAKKIFKNTILAEDLMKIEV